MPHRIETPSGVRYGIPVEVTEGRVTYEMVALDEAGYQRAIDEAMASFGDEITEAIAQLPKPPAPPE